MAKSQQRILVVGAGFAGMWSALAARRLITLESSVASDTLPIEVAVIAPKESLTVRPRLYESGPSNMAAPLGDLFAAAGVRFIPGTVDTINTEECKVAMVDSTGIQSYIHYDRLVLATGSRLVRPSIPGLESNSFSVDRIEDATRLEAHVQSLAKLPPSMTRNTVVVCGGGFTGIELASELPGRLRDVLGDDADLRVVIVEQHDEIGPELGPGPRPVINKVLQDIGVETKLGSGVAAIDAQGVITNAGERIETLTAVWTAGQSASPLTTQIPGDKDKFGRLHVDQYLRARSLDNVYATGDTAHAATDDDGNYTMMSCQHANILGRYSGHNAAADLLGLPKKAYSQKQYLTCLDLGPTESVITNGWERDVLFTGTDAKKVKKFINTVLIYPPKPNADEAFAAAEPVFYLPPLTQDFINSLS